MPRKNCFAFPVLFVGSLFVAAGPYSGAVLESIASGQPRHVTSLSEIYYRYWIAPGQSITVVAMSRTNFDHNRDVANINEDVSFGSPPFQAV